MPMQLDQAMLILSAVVVHTVVTGIASYLLYKSPSRRSRSLWPLTVIEGTAFAIGLPILYTLLRPQQTLETLSLVVYVAIGSFALILETPGYLMLSKHDEKTTRELDEIRSILIRTAFSFDEVAKLKSRSAKDQCVLEETGIGSLVDDFIVSCERMGNIDRSFWNTVLSELTRVIADVSNRSKHPVPKLVDILALTGLGFLLAQLLRTLG
jgi:hypothetical protein